MNWAWSLPLRPTTKLVLMSLSDVANDLGECFPSVKYIAERCCISTRHTRREIKKLIEIELLTTKARTRKDGSHTSNLYFLAIPKEIKSDNLSPPVNTRRQANPEVVTPKPGGNDLETLPLTTNDPSIKPTTTTDSFIWPESISCKNKTSILKLCPSISDVVVQELIDEMSSKIQSINNPVGYFYTLITKHKNDQFVPANANTVSSKRKAKKDTGLQYEQWLLESEQEVLTAISQFENKND